MKQIDKKFTILNVGSDSLAVHRFHVDLLNFIEKSVVEMLEPYEFKANKFITGKTKTRNKIDKNLWKHGLKIFIETIEFEEGRWKVRVKLLKLED